MSETRDPGKAGGLLAPFAEVREGEAATALSMAAQALVLLTVYYLLKPVRESWILPGGAELKTYLAAIQAIALVFVAKAYDLLAHRLRRDRLIAAAISISIVILLVFTALEASGLDLGVAFYLFLGAFQLLLIAQFWSFATDLYTPQQGRRLFAVLGAGAALGSVLGAQLARLLMRVLPSPAALLPIAAALLALVPALAAITHRREARVRGARPAPPVALADSEREGVLTRVITDPYLRLVAAFTVLLNAIATLGEYALDRTLLESAGFAVAHGEAISVEAYVGAFKADYYAAVNLLVLALQLFAVARLLRVLGERTALAILPAFVAIAALIALAVGSTALPMLAALAILRIIENGLAHSIQSTARQTLYFVTTREGRWSGRAFIDTAFWRAGDVLGALCVAALAASGGDARHVLAIVLALSIAWLAVVRALGREHRARCTSLGA